jgi:hypothetical protein
MAGRLDQPGLCVADTYGRLLGVLQKPGAGAPEIWRKKGQEAEAKVFKEKLPRMRSV